MTDIEVAIRFFNGWKNRDEKDRKILSQNTVAYNAYTKEIEYLELAIKALEQDPCEDCISRQAVLDDLEKSHMTSGVHNQGTWNECVDSMIRTVRSIPSVNQQPKTGHWIKTGYVDKVTCSICKRKMWNFWEVNDFNYCPDCGAKMSESEE